LPWFFIAAVGLAAFFGTALASLAASWQRPEYSFGPLVPIITILLVLRELQRRPALAGSGGWVPGFVLLVAGLLTGLLGNLARVPDIGTYGFILAIGGFTLIVAGPRMGLRFWPGWVHLVFMLPLPQFIYCPASALLRQIG
jgi:hypothetical protein